MVNCLMFEVRYMKTPSRSKAKQQAISIEKYVGLTKPKGGNKGYTLSIYGTRFFL